MAESKTSERVVAGRYRLLGELGRGGMGTVWRARDEVLEREVAVKELIAPPELTGPEREVFSIRTFREARAAGRLNHPGVAAVYDVFEEGGHPWIVLELVPSRTLGSVIREDGPLSPRATAQIGLQVLNALRAAHHAGVLHRDVKPDNVLLGENGRAVLTDFGIATLDDESHVTRTGALIGTPAFIAPERASGGLATTASDLWSLGVTMYFAVEGVSPFNRGTMLATLGAVMFDQPPPPNSAGPLGAVINGLLLKDPDARMTADEAERHLHAALTGTASALDGGPATEPTPAIPAALAATPAVARPVDGGAPGTAPAPQPSRQDFVRRGPRTAVVAAWIGGLAVLVGLVAGGIAYLTGMSQRTSQNVSPTVTVYRTAAPSETTSAPAVAPTQAGSRPTTHAQSPAPRKSPTKPPKASPSDRGKPSSKSSEGADQGDGSESADAGDGLVEPGAAVVDDHKGKAEGSGKGSGKGLVLG
ncbi:protein kinase [Streptosporangiaceae bacterium NEAU-GS5]|nr:protein kinase [Streptosporangiaceae bacterium NEAU-GS5]